MLPDLIDPLRTGVSVGMTAQAQAYPPFFVRDPDWQSYLSMASTGTGIKPMCYRPLVPWLAGFFPNPEAGFLYVNAVLGAGALLALYGLVSSHFGKRNFAAAVCVAWAATVFHPIRAAGYLVAIDPATSFMILAGMYLVESSTSRVTDAMVVVWSVLSVLTRDAGLLVPLYALWRGGKVLPLAAGTVTFAGLLAFVTPSVVVPQSYIHGFLQRTWITLRNPLYITSPMWRAFGPLGWLWLLPLIRGWPVPKGLYRGIYLLLVLSIFGGEHRESYFNWAPLMLVASMQALTRLPKLIFPTLAWGAVYLVMFSHPWVSGDDQTGVFGCDSTWPWKLLSTALGLSYLGTCLLIDRRDDVHAR